MIQNKDGSVTLEGDERVDPNREVEWLINEYLNGYDGAFVFPPTHPMHAGYWMMPYTEKPSVV